MNLTPQFAWFWNLGGSQSTRTELTQTQGEHANSVKEHSDLASNPAPSCSEGTEILKHCNIYRVKLLQQFIGHIV